MDADEMRRSGRALLLSLYSQNRWIIRTVDRVRFIDRNTVRRRIVCHFGLPHELEARSEIAGQCWLPVFTLPKGSFISCDLRDADDRKIALRPIQERWDLTFQAFLALIREADPAVAKDALVQGLAMDLISCTRRGAKERLQVLRSHYSNVAIESPGMRCLVLSPEFANLTSYLSRNYLVFVGVESDDNRAHMISYVVDQRFADRPRDFIGANMPPKRSSWRRTYGLEPHQYFHPWAITGAGSSHLDIEAPDGVDFGTREVRLPGHGLLDPHPGTSTRHARFLAPRTLPGGEGYARINIHPGSGVMRSAGPYVGALFCLLLAVVAIGTVDSTNAASLLLILPSVASFVAARPNEHPYVTRVVRGVRYLTLFPIPAASLAVAIVAADLPRVLLYVLLLACIAATAVLAAGARRLKTRPAYTELVLDDLTRIA